MKRSAKIALVTMGVSTLALTACKREEVQASIFKSVDECVASKSHTPDACADAYAYAVSEHDLVSPRYKSHDDCEAEVGAEQCEEAPYDGKRTSYRPLVAAFMFSRAGVASQPLYRNAATPQAFRTASNRLVPARSGNVKVAKAAGAKPRNRLYSERRGGFGSTARRTGSRASG
ncbi:MAG: DUF1190 domain-containing protein [Pseudomonadota bacterium]